MFDAALPLLAADAAFSPPLSPCCHMLIAAAADAMLLAADDAADDMPLYAPR